VPARIALPAGEWELALDSHPRAPGGTAPAELPAHGTRIFRRLNEA
jgi:hypothetical protein